MAEEIVLIVDAENRECGAAPRSRMRAGRLWHRATYILVLDSEGRLYVQKRTMAKDIYPGYYDPATGGVVLAGEDWDESARRELAEEMGIRDVALTVHGDFAWEDERSRVWGRIFSCRWDGPVIPQPEEVESVHRMSVSEILDPRTTLHFTPDGLYALRRYVAATSRSL